MTTALIQLVKLDSFYADEMDNKKLLKVALSHSMLTKKLKNLLLSRIDYYEEDTKSLKNLLEFI